PIRFEANAGQTDERVRFVGRGAGYGLFLTTDGGSTFVLSSGRGGAVLRMDLVGAQAAPPSEGQEGPAGPGNSFRGSDPARWQTDVANYGRVLYRDVYPGTDLAYYGSDQGRLEYDFLLRPGSDPAAVRLAFAGAEGAEVDGDGNLVLHTTAGDF